MCIGESEEDKSKERHFVEAHTLQKDTKEENIGSQEEQLVTEVLLNVQQATKV